MNKISKYVLLFIVVSLLVGCSKKQTTSNKIKEVKDEEIITILQNKITILEGLTKTKEIYTKGDGKASDYIDEDKIRYGINYKISTAGVPALSNEEIVSLKQKGINDVSSYIEIKEISNTINGTFSDSITKYIDSNGCPKYIYDEVKERYYIQSKCETEDSTSIISRIDKVTNKNNKYYVDVYAGLNDGTNIYSDFDKKNLIKILSSNDSYTITDEDKKMFTKFKYTFEKTSDGMYIFKSITKVK